MKGNLTDRNDRLKSSSIELLGIPAGKTWTGKTEEANYQNLKWEIDQLHKHINVEGP